MHGSVMGWLSRGVVAAVVMCVFSGCPLLPPTPQATNKRLTREDVEQHLASVGIEGAPRTLTDDFADTIIGAHYIYSGANASTPDPDAAANYNSLTPLGRDTLAVLASLGSTQSIPFSPSAGEYLSTYHYFRGGLFNESLLVSLSGAWAVTEGMLDRLHRPDFWSDAPVGGAGAYASLGDGKRGHRFWAAGTGEWNRAGRRKGDYGYSHDYAGAMFGYEKVMNDFAAGGAFGYGRGDFENKALLRDDTDIDFYNAHLYAVARRFGWTLSVTGGYSRTRYDSNWLVTTTPSIIRDTPRYHADTWSGGGTLGYDFHPATGLTLTPSVGLFHMHARSGRIATRHITVNNRITERLTRMPVELRAAYSLAHCGSGSLGFTGVAGYAYDLQTGGTEARFNLHNVPFLAPITARRRVDSRHSYRVGAGVEYATARYSLGVEYQYRGRTDYDSHNVTGTASLSF